MNSYRTVIFSPSVKGRKNAATEVEKQLQHVINQNASEGWEYYSMETCHIHVEPGCLEGIFGKKEALFTYDMIIFIKTA